MGEWAGGTKADQLSPYVGDSEMQFNARPLPFVAVRSIPQMMVAAAHGGEEDATHTAIKRRRRRTGVGSTEKKGDRTRNGLNRWLSPAYNLYASQLWGDCPCCSGEVLSLSRLL